MSFAAGVTRTSIRCGFAIIVSATLVDAMAMNQVGFGDASLPAVFCLAANITTCLGWHGYKAVPLAAGMARACILCGFAFIVSLAGVSALTLNKRGRCMLRPRSWI